jgi:polygalacturonase
MSVLDNHFYTGHGMSIGSETVGQAYLLVDGLVEDHTSSGIRIKSNVTRGGSVHDLTYRDICMRNVANPIAISPYYTNQTTEGFIDPGYTGTNIPDYKRILIDDLLATTPGNVLIAGWNDDHRTEIALRNVHVDGIHPDQVHMNFVDVVAIDTNLDLHGKSVRVLDVGKGSEITFGMDTGSREASRGPFSCRNAFVPMR